MAELVTPVSTTIPTQARRTPIEPDATGALAALRAAMPDRVVGPDDASFEGARLGWVVNVDQRPVAVVAVRDVADVSTAVRIAAAHGLSVSVQPVGHGATEACTGTVLLRTAALDEISVDAEARVLRVGAGVKWGAALAAVQPTGLIAPAGSSPDPSVAGFTLGGGLSWFSRAVGLAAESVVALDVVDATGAARRVTADSEPDLFWALCGGGGDVAVVTALELRLTDAGALRGGRMMWPVEMAWPVLQAFREATTTAPEELSLWATLFRFPPMPDLPEMIRGKSFVAIDLTYLGDGDLDELVLPFRRLPTMLMDTVGPWALGRLGEIADEPIDPMPIMESGHLLHDLTEDDVDALVRAAGPDAGIALNVVQVRHIGGALTRSSADSGPHGPVSERFSLFMLGVPAVPELVPAIEGGFASVQAALADEISGRTLYTFSARQTDTTTCFDAATRERLRAVKVAADPAGTIRSNRPTS